MDKNNSKLLKSISLFLANTVLVSCLAYYSQQYKGKEQPTTSISDIDDELTTEKEFQVTEKKYSLDELRILFNNTLISKKFDEKVVETLEYIYNQIDENYDNFKDANPFLQLPSKEDFIKKYIIDCLNNNIETITMADFNNERIQEILGADAACYFYVTKEACVGIAESYSISDIAGLLSDEAFGHGNQYASVGSFGKYDDIIIEGHPGIFRELLSATYIYDDRAEFSTDTDIIRCYGPYTSIEYNLVYKFSGIIMMLVGYPTYEQALKTKSLDPIVKSLNDQYGPEINILLPTMVMALQNSRNPDLTEESCICINNVDDTVLDTFDKRIEGVSSVEDADICYKAFLKFEQQYLSRYVKYESESIIDITEEKNEKFNEIRERIIQMCLYYNVIDNYTYDGYCKLFSLATRDNNRNIGIETDKGWVLS